MYCLSLDIDECAMWSDRGGRLCLGVCENTIGSYQCSCPDGYRMMSDGRTCQGEGQNRDDRWSNSFHVQMSMNVLNVLPIAMEWTMSASTSADLTNAKP
jgi:hypothetical protein